MFILELDEKIDTTLYLCSKYKVIFKRLETGETGFFPKVTKSSYKHL